VFNASGLLKYWFPVSKMPQNGQDWPLVSDMVASNQRLVVFTSIRSKQSSEGIAYQWNFMVENNCEAPTLQIFFFFFCGLQLNTTSMLEDNIVYLISDGDDGMDAGQCSNRAESAPLNDKTKSLVLMNYFPSVPVKFTACLQHSQNLIDMVNTCYGCDVIAKLKL